MLFKKKLTDYEVDVLRQLGDAAEEKTLFERVTHLSRRECHNTVLDFRGTSTESLRIPGGEWTLGYAIFSSHKATFTVDVALENGRLMIVEFGLPFVDSQVVTGAMLQSWHPLKLWEQSGFSLGTRSLQASVEMGFAITAFPGIEWVSYYQGRFSEPLDATFIDALLLGQNFKNEEICLSMEDPCNWYWNPWSKSKAVHLLDIGRSADGDVLLVIENKGGAAVYIVVNQEDRKKIYESRSFAESLSRFIEYCRDTDR